MQRLKRRIIIETLILAGFLSLVFFGLHKNFLALGLLVGTFTAIACFQILARTIVSSSSVALQKIKPYFFLKYLIRYVIMGAVLFLCIKVDLQFFFAAASGLLLIYVVIFLDNFIAHKRCKILAK